MDLNDNKQIANGSQYGQTITTNCNSSNHHKINGTKLEYGAGDAQTKQPYQCCSNNLDAGQTNSFADANETELLPPNNHLDNDDDADHPLMFNRHLDGPLVDLNGYDSVAGSSGSGKLADGQHNGDPFGCDNETNKLQTANDNCNGYGTSTTTTTTATDSTNLTDVQRRHSVGKRDSTGSRAPGRTKQRQIIRKFQKLDPSALSATPAPDVKIGQRVAYKEYYGNEFGTIRWIGEFFCFFLGLFALLISFDWRDVANNKTNIICLPSCQHLHSLITWNNNENNNNNINYDGDDDDDDDDSSRSSASN